jgi:hypothetical protein
MGGALDALRLRADGRELCQMVREDAGTALPAQVRLRLLAVHSQALAMAVAAFAWVLGARLSDTLFLHQLEAVGFLLHCQR